LEVATLNKWSNKIYTSTIKETFSVKDGLSACIWELEIIHFESMARMKYVVKQNDNPDYHKYLKERLNVIL
jgi:hypothetical protein